MFHNNYKTNLTVAVIATCALVLGFATFPDIGDDLGYRIPFRPYFEGDSGFSLWDGICDSIAYRYNCDNPRFANVTMILTAWLPRWIPAIVSGFAAWVLLWYGAALGDFRNRTTAFAVWVAGFIICFPWVDQMYMVDFQMNYLWSTAAAVWLLYALLRTHTGAVVLFIVGLFLGLWHEAIAAGTLCGLVALIVLYRQLRTRRIVASAAGIIAGMVYLFAAPSFAGHSAFLTGRENIIYIFVLPTAVFAVVWAINLWRAKSRNTCLDPVTIALATIAVAGTGFGILFPLGPRTMSLPVIASLIGICIFIHARIRWLSILIYCFLAIHLFYVDRECIRSASMTAEVIKQYQADHDSIIYADLTLRADAPALCLQKPYFDWFTHRNSASLFTKMYGDPEHPIRVVPGTVRGFSPDDASATKIPGDVGAFYYNGQIIAPVDYDKPAISRNTATTDGHTFSVDLYFVPLRNGYAWFCIRPKKADLIFDFQVGFSFCSCRGGV